MTHAKHTQERMEKRAMKIECPGMDGGDWVVCRRDKYGKRQTVAHVYDESVKNIIIHAVNTHDALVEALDELTASVTAFKTAHEQYKFGMVIPPRILEAYEQARAALKLAKGERE